MHGIVPKRRGGNSTSAVSKTTTIIVLLLLIVATGTILFHHMVASPRTDTNRSKINSVQRQRQHDEEQPNYEDVPATQDSSSSSSNQNNQLSALKPRLREAKESLLEDVRRLDDALVVGDEGKKRDSKKSNSNLKRKPEEALSSPSDKLGNPDEETHIQHHEQQPEQKQNSRTSRLTSSTSSSFLLHYFQNIHTNPLDVNSSPLKRLLPPTPSSEFDANNALWHLYRDIEETHEDNSFFHTGPSALMWNAYPQLRKLLKKFVHLNRNFMQHAQSRRKRTKNGGWKFGEPGMPAGLVVVQPVGQLCNRLVAITSGFMFALLTKRVLVIEDDGFYAASSDLFENPGFEWVNTVPYAAILGGSGSDGEQQHVIQNPESGTWAETEPLLCANYSKHYKRAQVVRFAMNQYIVPYMTSNEHYRKDLMQFARGDNFFHPIARFLFRPISKLLRMQQNFMDKHFAGKFVVGLQVRSGQDFTSHFMSKEDWSLYERCAEKTIPEKHSATGQNATTDSDKSGEERRKEKNNKEVVFFVATDTAEGRVAAKKYLGSSNRNNNKIIFGPTEFKFSNHPEGVQMALLDLLLLSAADDRVTTAWSSYGYFASGYNGLPSNMVVDKPSSSSPPPGTEQLFMGVPHKSDTRLQCVRLPTAQPCFHKFATWGAQKASCFRKEWITREMLNGRYC